MAANNPNGGFNANVGAKTPNHNTHPPADIPSFQTNPNARSQTNSGHGSADVNTNVNAIMSVNDPNNNGGLALTNPGVEPNANTDMEATYHNHAYNASGDMCVNSHNSIPSGDMHINNYNYITIPGASMEANHARVEVTNGNGESDNLRRENERLRRGYQALVERHQQLCQNYRALSQQCNKAKCYYNMVRGFYSFKVTSEGKLLPMVPGTGLPAVFGVAASQVPAVQCQHEALILRLIGTEIPNNPDFLKANHRNPFDPIKAMTVNIPVVIDLTTDSGDEANVLMTPPGSGNHSPAHKNAPGVDIPSLGLAHSETSAKNPTTSINLADLGCTASVETSSDSSRSSAYNVSSPETAGTSIELARPAGNAATSTRPGKRQKRDQSEMRWLQHSENSALRKAQGHYSDHFTTWMEGVKAKKATEHQKGKTREAPHVVPAAQSTGAGHQNATAHNSRPKRKATEITSEDVAEFTHLFELGEAEEQASQAVGGAAHQDATAHSPRPKRKAAEITLEDVAEFTHLLELDGAEEKASQAVGHADADADANNVANQASQFNQCASLCSAAAANDCISIDQAEGVQDRYVVDQADIISGHSDNHFTGTVKGDRDRTAMASFFDFEAYLAAD